MLTQMLPISDAKYMDQVRRAFAAHQPVAIPTDTVYGLSCPFDCIAGVEALYKVKGRPPGKAIPILLGKLEQLALVALPIQSEMAAALAARFWPGPLTLILAARPTVPPGLLAGGETIAVRVVDHPIFQEISGQMGPLATTSANLSGRPDCSLASEVYKQLQGRIPLIVDAGQSPENCPSTIVKVEEQQVTVVRSGSLATAVEEFLSG